MGAGAHSYTGGDASGSFGRRWREEKNPVRYMERVAREGAAAMEYENLDAAVAAAEFMFMGLRTMRGVSTSEFVRRFGKRPAEVYPEIDAWLAAGLMEAESGRLRLGRRGLMVADEIFLAFVLDMGTRLRISIEAPADMVWDVIANLRGAREWAPGFDDYPFISSDWPRRSEERRVGKE